MEESKTGLQKARERERAGGMEDETVEGKRKKKKTKKTNKMSSYRFETDKMTAYHPETLSGAHQAHHAQYLAAVEIDLLRVAAQKHVDVIFDAKNDEIAFRGKKEEKKAKTI